MLNKLYKSRWYPIIPQILTLLVFVFLIIGSLDITTDNGTFAKQLRNTNLSNLIVWSYWWPLIVLTAILIGRHWCSICPIELVSHFTNRFGMRLKVPKIIKSGWIIVIIYAGIAIIAIHTYGIHRVPRLMAFYLLSLLGLSILVSLIFEKRAFCSYFCPVGKLLGLYSLLSSLGLRVNKEETCSSCKSKECISNKQKDKLIGRSCQSNLYPAKVEDNRDCILCTQCVKACPNSNIEIKYRKNSFLSFNPDRLSLAEIGMINILIGFVSYEILSSWKEGEIILSTILNPLYQYLFTGILSFKLYEGIILFLVLPCILTFSITVVSKLLGKNSFLTLLKRTMIFLLPTIALGHLFKALLKTTSRIPYWKYALDKPDGLYYAEKIVQKEILLESYPLIDSLTIVLGILILYYAILISLRKIIYDKHIIKGQKYLYSTIVVAYTAILLYGPILDILT